MDKTILVTGSRGFIGQALCRTASESYRIIGLDRSTEPAPGSDPAQTIPCDLGSDASVAAAMRRIEELGVSTLAAVVHLAGEVRLERKASIADLDRHVQDQRRLTSALGRFQVEQFIFASTMLVHAPSPVPGCRIDENWRMKPAWHFPQVKRVEEEFFQEHAAWPFVALRMAGVYDDGCHSLQLAQQIERIRRKRITSRHYAGNPAHGQAYVHVLDLVDCILRAIDRRHVLPRTTAFLVGEGATPSYKSLQQSIGWLLHQKPWKTQQVSKFLARSTFWLQYRIAEIEPFLQPWMIDIADHHYELNTERAAALLGWKARSSVSEKIPGMIAALQADPIAWDREHGLGPVADPLQASSAQ